MGWDHVEKVDKHESQKDYKTGFGGNNIVFFCEISLLVYTTYLLPNKVYLLYNLLHTFVGMKFHLIFSSTIYFFVKSDVYIFNLGEFGVHKGMDKSAVGWDHIEKVEKHESQKGKKIYFKKSYYS